MLPYTAEVLFALFDEYNQAIRPLQGVALFLTAGVLMLALRSRENRSRIIVAILAAGWFWTGVVFHLVYFTELNFAAPAYGIVFILQGFLLFWTGVYRNRISIRFQRKPASYAGAAIFILSSLILPVIDWHHGLSWTEARFALLAPGTTARLTLGLLMMVDRRPPLLGGGNTGTLDDRCRRSCGGPRYLSGHRVERRRAFGAILARRPCTRFAGAGRRYQSVVAFFELCDFVEAH